MNRKEFIEKLREKLKRLPKEEIENAVSFYEEYFDEAGAENEQKIIKELVSPAHLASKIIGELAITETESKEEKKKTGVTIWIILAAIFASPIALPLAFAAVMVLLAAVIVVASVYGSLFVTGASVAIGGVTAAIASFTALPISVPTGIFAFGAGLFMMAAGVAICVGTALLTKITFVGIKKLLAKFLVRRGSR